MPHAHTKDQPVEQPAIGLFAELGWTALPVPTRLNRVLPLEATAAAVDELTRDRSAMSLFSGQMDLKTN